MFDLTGKKAIVTGSTQGVGFAIAELFSKQGATVFVNGASSEEKTKCASDKIPNSVPVTVDLSKPDCADKMYEKTGDVDILVLNASIQIRKTWELITEEEMKKQIAVNFESSIKLMQKYVPHMKENKWGRIVVIGSIQQRKPHKEMLIYSAMKNAMLSVSESLAKDLAPYNITVNNVAPGVIGTPRNADALKDEDYKKVVIDNIPAGYIAKPEDCAAEVLLLCCEEGRYITGTDIFIDGGMKL